MILSALLATLQDPAATGAPVTGASDGAPPAGGTPAWMQFAPMIAIFAIFYFVMIGPERKNRKKREAMLKAMKKGDKVMTTGGMYGHIAAISDNEITLQLAEGVRVKFARQAIQEVIAETTPDASEKH